MGHGIFEAPAWIHAERNAAMPSLFDGLEPSSRRRVWRTITPSESHFSATYPPGSKEFFQEARANEFMGSLLAPRRLLSRQFAARCEALGMRPTDFMPRTTESLLEGQQSETEKAPKGNVGFVDVGRCIRLGQVVTSLAMDFGVTGRLTEVRLKKYRLMRQYESILYP